MTLNELTLNEPCDLNAVDARRLIGRKRLSPVELLESCIARIEMVNPTINAVVATCATRLPTRKSAKPGSIASRRTARCGIAIPLGRPVEPEVNMT